MIKIGLTGGIGSGKSTIARIFNLLGIPIYDSDTEAKKLYTTDKILKDLVVKSFGSKAYRNNGEINKKFLRDHVFTDSAKLNLLNRLVHPRVKINFENWLTKNSGVPVIIKEAAILFESGASKQVDKIIVVTAPDELRIKRVTDRDKIDREAVLLRMKNQWPQHELINHADFVIDNSGNTSVLNQIFEIYQYLTV